MRRVRASRRTKGDHGAVVRFPLNVPEHPSLLFSIVFGGVNSLLIVAGIWALWRARSSARKSFMSVRQVADALREGRMSLGQAKSALTGAHWTRRPALSLFLLASPLPPSWNNWHES
jgi:hypothetical protein